MLHDAGSTHGWYAIVAYILKKELSIKKPLSIYTCHKQVIFPTKLKPQLQNNLQNSISGI